MNLTKKIEEGLTLKDYLFWEDYQLDHLKTCSGNFLTRWFRKEPMSYTEYINSLSNEDQMTYKILQHARRDTECFALMDLLYEDINFEGIKEGKYVTKFVEYYENHPKVLVRDGYKNLTRPYKDIIDRFKDSTVEWEEAYRLSKNYPIYTELKDIKLGLTFLVGYYMSGDICLYVRNEGVKQKLTINEYVLKDALNSCRANIATKHKQKEQEGLRKIEQELIKMYDTLGGNND